MSDNKLFVTHKIINIKSMNDKYIMYLNHYVFAFIMMTPALES